MSSEKELLEELLKSNSKLTLESLVNLHTMEPKSSTNINNTNSTMINNSNSKSFVDLGNLEPKMSINSDINKKEQNNG